MNTHAHTQAAATAEFNMSLFLRYIVYVLATVFLSLKMKQHNIVDTKLPL